MIFVRPCAKHSLLSLAATAALVLTLGACSSLSSQRAGDAAQPQPAAQTPSPKAGDAAPDIALLDASSDGIVKLSDYRGQVVFMEFWSSVSAPCLNAMADCDLLAIRHKTDWAGKAVIVGVSLDETRGPSGKSPPQPLDPHAPALGRNPLARIQLHRQAQLQRHHASNGVPYLTRR